MPEVYLCDATGEPLGPSEGFSSGWGHPRRYKEAVEADIDAYYLKLRESAEAARQLFVRLRAEARGRFYTKYPNGTLPDEPA